MSTSVAPLSQRRQLGSLLRAVVKVLCVSDAPDYDQPWQTDGPTNSVGSGVIVDTSRGLRVLTNAHCVANHVFVEVRRYGKARKVVANVEAIGHECDLALLEVDDESFFGNTAPIAIGALPHLGDRVSVCGYPIGGERLSITEGIVSRIDLVCYAQSNRELLAVQIDAAINAGNSGGPVLKDGRLVGVAFQALDEGEQIGYMIAPPVVEHFLKDLEDGTSDGFPALGVTTQQLESSTHRRFLGLTEDQPGGVLVRRVAHSGSADGVLEPDDVLLAVDNEPVSADGTVELRRGELVHYRYFVSRRHVGERIPVTVWRQRQEVTCVLDLKPPAYLVAEERYDVRPSYYIVGGLLFAPLTRDFLKTWGDTWWQSAPRDLVALYEVGVPTPERTEPVVLQKVLAHRVNQGYHDLDNLLVDTCYGVPVRSLTHLVTIIEDHTDEPYLELRTSDGTAVVLDRAEAMQRNENILRKYGVRHDRSVDLRSEGA